ncbi:MAG: hypothetical protein KF889_17995 [Alphaproteobacteria bacterium]|nr:hypothetical protein [Alphaproteobacteria bacterium]MCW5741346.1 hypothetical protein [Alphaproteobacteria bacterium]
MAVALINPAVHPAAIPYFTRYPLEPIPNNKFVTIEKFGELRDTVVVKGKATTSNLTNLTTLLKAILDKAKAGGDVVIVMHGNDAGLFVRIASGIGFNAAAMRALVMGLEGRTEDDVTHKLLKLTPADWSSLKDQMLKMQALELNRVDLRACVVGKEPDVMWYLQKIFNCAVCCAPKAYDFYGLMDLGSPTKDAKVWEKWLASHPGANVQTFSSGRFAYHHTISENSIKVEALTDSQEAATGWVTRNLPKGNYSGGAIWFHGLTDKKSPLIFAGDPRYRDYLVEAVKDAPMPKIDVNAPIAP